MKTTKEMLQELKEKGYKLDLSFNGDYYRLIDKDGNIVNDDPGCEDMYDKDFAICCFYSQIIL